MKFYINDKTEEELDILIDILKSERICYRNPKINKSITVQPSFFGFVSCSSLEIGPLIIDTDLEHFDYINFLFKKKLKKIKAYNKKLEKLESCLKLKQAKTKKKVKSNKEIKLETADKF